jgi:hypothetical protein
MKTERQKTKEQLIIADFVGLCHPSLYPELYSSLVEDIVPALQDVRHLPVGVVNVEEVEALRVRKGETKEGDILIERAYSGICMRTEEGNEIGICMRDDTFEINVMPGGESEGNWWCVDMQDKTINKQ